MTPKLTNREGLSPAIERACGRDWYSGTGENRDFSVTQLLNPVKIVHLTRRHKDEIIEDVADRLYMLMGSAMHAILERSTEHEAEHIIMERMRGFFNFMYENPGLNRDRAVSVMLDMLEGDEGQQPLDQLFQNLTQDRFIVEKRFKYVSKGGYVITGGIDLYDRETRILHDYKLTSVFTWIFKNQPGSRFVEFNEQLNMYRLFMERMGYSVDKLMINLVFRDWSKKKAQFDRTYPDCRAKTAQLEMLGLDVVESMIENKIANITQYDNVPDDQIPECTQLQRWQRRETYAIMCGTNKNATKVFYGWKDANDHIEGIVASAIAKKPTANPDTIRAEYRIEKRESVPLRCLEYCSVRQFCHYGRSLKIDSSQLSSEDD